MRLRPREVIAQLLATVDGRAFAPSERLRVGWPRGAAVVCVALPILIAGPLRFVSRLDLGWCYLLATLLTLAAAAPLVRALRVAALSPAQEVAAHVALVAVALFAGALTYNRHFHGLPQYLAPDGWGGADGGYHVMNYMDFTRRTSNVYGGFVSMYSFWDATRRFGSKHLIVGLNVCFAYCRVVVAVVPCAIAFAMLHRFRGNARAWWSGALACVVVSGVAQYVVALPLENFHLMGGFWPHLVGLVPLMLVWMVDALVRPRLLRMLLMLGCVVLYRFTYGLNLADLLFAIGALLLIEMADRHATAWWVRAALAAVAIAALFASRYCYTLTTRLFGDVGWIVDHDMATATVGLELAIAAFAVTICAWPASLSPSPNGIARALRFPLFYCLGTVFFLAMIRHIPPKTSYYLQKYDFHALVLAAGAVVVLGTFGVASLVAGASRSGIVRLAGALAIGTAALVTMHRSIAAYDGVFREQVYGRGFAFSYPWVVPAVVRHIDTVLAREQKAFGGYLTRHYGTRLVTNGLFDYGDRAWMYSPRADASSGHCVFWESGRGFAQDLDPKKECATYQQIPFGRLTICHSCF